METRRAYGATSWESSQSLWMNLMDKPRLLGAIQPKEQPSGSATLRVNLMGECIQRIEPQGSKPRRMDETSWQQPCLMGDNTSRRSLMECTAVPIGGAATPTGFAPWRVGEPHGRTYWVSRA